MSPQEIHQLGLDEVARVRNEMETIAASDGYEGKLPEYLEYLRTSPEFEPKSAPSLLAHYRDIIGRGKFSRIYHGGACPTHRCCVIRNYVVVEPYHGSLAC